MSPYVKTHFSAEMHAARQAYGQGDYADAFAHLERAHILGQRWFWPHTVSHGWMLRVGWQMKDRREIIGQLLRLFLTPLGHLTGRLPIGNNGRASVSAFAPMPVPDDLAAILRAGTD